MRTARHAATVLLSLAVAACAPTATPAPSASQSPAAAISPSIGATSVPHAALAFVGLGSAVRQDLEAGGYRCMDGTGTGEFSAVLCSAVGRDMDFRVVSRGSGVIAAFMAAPSSGSPMAAAAMLALAAPVLRTALGDAGRQAVDDAVRPWTPAETERRVVLGSLVVSMSGGPTAAVDGGLLGISVYARDYFLIANPGLEPATAP